MHLGHVYYPNNHLLSVALEAPSNFHCSATSSRALLCSWEPPSTTDYILLDYDIAHTLVDGYDFYSEYGEKTETNGLLAGMRMLTLSGLQPYTGYIVELTSNFMFLDLESGSGDNETESGSASEEITERGTSVISFTWEEGDCC